MKTETLVTLLVNRYIGVSSTGYLGLPENERFTYRSLAEFYPEYCDLSKDPNQIEDTRTRVRFTEIFKNSSPAEQAKIIRGSIERFPVGKDPKTRTMELKDRLLEEATKLERLGFIESPVISTTSGVVFETLEDAQLLIRERKAVSAVDRVHTALHGYLKSLCGDAGITFHTDEDIVALLKKILSMHPKLQIAERAEDIRIIIRGLASVSHSLNPIRNHGSLAHANEALLEEPEATLVINTVRTLMMYLESKLKQ